MLGTKEDYGHNAVQGNLLDVVVIASANIGNVVDLSQVFTWQFKKYPRLGKTLFSDFG